MAAVVRRRERGHGPLGGGRFPRRPLRLGVGHGTQAAAGAGSAGAVRSATDTGGLGVAGGAGGPGECGGRAARAGRSGGVDTGGPGEPCEPSGRVGCLGGLGCVESPGCLGGCPGHVGCLGGRAGYVRRQGSAGRRPYTGRADRIGRIDRMGHRIGRLGHRFGPRVEADERPAPSATRLGPTRPGPTPRRAGRPVGQSASPGFTGRPRPRWRPATAPVRSALACHGPRRGRPPP